MQQYDLAIIGGGLIGASFARAIAGSGLRTLLIDRVAAEDLYSPALDNRGLAISYTTKKILDKLNLWAELCSKAYAIENVHVSERGSFGFTKLSAADCSLPALGYVISASNLGFALSHDLESVSDLAVLRPETITGMSFDTTTSMWQLVLSQQTVAARLLIAADGSNSIIRKTQSIVVNVKDYDQTAIVTNLRVNIKNLTTAFERFTQQGVLALLPFGAQQLKCILTMTNSSLPEFMNMADAQFLAMVQQAIGFRLGKLVSIDARKTFPIIHTYAEKLVGNSMVLLGNAANTLHPVAAQGFNLGIRDAMCLAKVLRHAINTCKEINSAAVLQNYVALRQQDHYNTRKFSNNIVEIFGHEMSLMKVARRIGLVAAQLLPGARAKLIAQGLGVWT